MRKLVLLNVFLLCILFSKCQKFYIPYETFSAKNGLTDNYVHCIIQDHTGFIWIGGGTGLFRYDGYNFVYYKHPPGCKNCAPFNQVYSLEEDNLGLIWVLSRTGIYLFDPETERSISAYRFGSDSISARLTSDYLDLMLDSKGNMWATNGRGLIKFSLGDSVDAKELLFSNESVVRFRIEFIHLDQDIFSIKNITHKIYEDDQGNVWVGTFDGLCLLKKGDSVFHRLDIASELHSGKNTYINDILQLNEDSFYIISGKNFMMTNVKEAISKPAPEGSDIHFECLPLPEQYIAYCLYKDRKNNVYIGTNLNVFRILRNSPQSVFSYEPLYINPVDASDNKTYKYVHQIMEDRTGILWSANYFYGLIKYNLQPPKFKSYKKEIETYFSNTDVNHIIIDSQGNLWIGVFGGGLYKIQNLTNQVIRYDLKIH